VSGTSLNLIPKMPINLFNLLGFIESFKVTGYSEDTFFQLERLMNFKEEDVYCMNSFEAF
jgi:hypothetical protein